MSFSCIQKSAIVLTLQFFNHFHEQNQKIESGEKEGIALDFESLGIINGIIDEAIQASHYPEFAVKNTYGIKSVSSHPC